MHHTSTASLTLKLKFGLRTDLPASIHSFMDCDHCTKYGTRIQHVACRNCPNSSLCGGLIDPGGICQCLSTEYGISSKVLYTASAPLDHRNQCRHMKTLKNTTPKQPWTDNTRWNKGQYENKTLLENTLQTSIWSFTPTSMSSGIES